MVDYRHQIVGMGVMPETLPDNVKRVRRNDKIQIGALLVLAYLIFTFGTAITFYIQNRNNKDRIMDVQQNRLSSCKTTYDSIRLVFKPFFPPKNQRTKKVQHDIDRLDHTIDMLKKGCS